MTAVDGDFGERTAQPRVRSLPLSHVSLELGHLYMEDIAAGPDRLAALFEETLPWTEATLAATQKQLAKGRARVSTCFLVDDYFSDLQGPKELVPLLLDAAEHAGVVVDYLARESSCALVSGPRGDVAPAELLIGRLVTEPTPGTTGGRPPSIETGWLANGRRSPSLDSAAAMDVIPTWQPPEQTAKRRHSVFVDVEMWDGTGIDRKWSCALLAAVWQTLRLGLLRSDGEPLVEPTEAPGEWPDDWSELAPVTQLNPRAAPFAAYRTMSILSPRFLPVEVGVRTILAQVYADPEVGRQIADRAAAEGLRLGDDLLDRVAYAFTGSGTTDPF